jgi:hypothetical protein
VRIYSSFKSSYKVKKRHLVLTCVNSAAWIGYATVFATNIDLQWRLPLAIQNVTPLILLLGVYWIPESPRYLCLKDRNDEALAVLKKIHHDPADPSEATAVAEHFQIMQQVQLDRQIPSGYIDMFRNPSWRKRCILTIFLLFATQSAGVLGVGNYSIIIYQSLGMKGSKALLMYACYNLVGTIPNAFSALLMDRIGRRTMFRKFSNILSAVKED